MVTRKLSEKSVKVKSQVVRREEGTQTFLIIFHYGRDQDNCGSFPSGSINVKYKYGEKTFINRILVICVAIPNSFILLYSVIKSSIPKFVRNFTLVIVYLPIFAFGYYLIRVVTVIMTIYEAEVKSFVITLGEMLSVSSAYFHIKYLLIFL